MGKGIDFSDYLTYIPPAPPPEEKVDMSIWHKKNQDVEKKFDFDETISDLGVAITEVEYRKAIPIIITEADINRWILGGAPMY